jgi:lipoprotein-releasing system permease protein
MIKLFEWMIAIRYLRSKRKDSFISVVSGFSMVGIMLGVATLIIVLSVMKGFHNEFLKHVLGIQGHITLVHETGKFKEYNSLVEEVGKVDGVDFIAPLVIGQGMVVNGKFSSGVVVRGIEPEKFMRKPLAKDSILPEVGEEFLQHKGIILGIALARELHVRPGDTIRLVAPSQSVTFAGMLPRTKNYKVIGTFDVGLQTYNATTMFMPLSDAQLFFNSENAVTEVEVMVRNPDEINNVKERIGKVVGESAIIIDWKRAQAKFLNALEVERTVMFLILTLIILIAVFNIISSLIMLVKDKAKNIAILRTIGASKTSIVKIFVICGSVIGITGTFLGAVFGIAFATNIEAIRHFLEHALGTELFDPVVYFLTRLPSELEISSVILVVSMSLFFSILSTIYPAWRASRLMPVEVLRNE